MIAEKITTTFGLIHRLAKPLTFIFLFLKTAAKAALLITAVQGMTFTVWPKELL